MDGIEARGTDAERRRAAAERRRIEQDGNLAEPLERMAYEAGIMLGVEAMRAEQDYLLRRLARLQRWLAGGGTLYGLAVAIGSEARPDGATGATLEVAPGQGIDGLGRDVLVPEAYAMSLTDWIARQAGDEASRTELEAGFVPATNRLHLRVTVRAAESPRGFQPAVTAALNLGSDAVVTSRVADSFLLELAAEPPPQGGAHPPDSVADALARWLPDGEPLPDAAGQAAGLTQREQDFLAGIGDARLAAMLRLQAHLLRQAPPDPCQDAADRQACLARAARIELARLTVAADSATPALVAPGMVTVNNLTRPFLLPPPVLARLLG